MVLILWEKPLLAVVLSPTVTSTGTLPLLSIAPTIFRLPSEFIKEPCFVILTELSLLLLVAYAFGEITATRIERIEIARTTVSVGNILGSTPIILCRLEPVVKWQFIISNPCNNTITLHIF